MVNSSFNWLVWLGYKCLKLLLAVILWVLVEVLYFSVHIFLYIYSFEWFNVWTVVACFHVSSRIQNLLTISRKPLNKNLIGQGAWLIVFASVPLDEYSVTQARHHGVLFLHPSEAQQQLNEVQRIWGILRPGGFTLNSFFASVIHGAWAKRLDNLDSVFWLYVVLSLCCVTRSNRFIEALLFKHFSMIKTYSWLRFYIYTSPNYRRIPVDFWRTCSLHDWLGHAFH